MARRTTSTLVRDLGGWGSSINMDAFIDTATKLVDKVATCAGGDLDEQQLELIERWLSAHFYESIHPGNSSITSKSVGGASMSFGRSAMGSKLESTPFGQQALLIDTSGCLDTLLGEKVSFTWLGSDDEDYDTEWNS